MSQIGIETKAKMCITIAQDELGVGADPIEVEDRAFALMDEPDSVIQDRVQAIEAQAEQVVNRVKKLREG